MWRELEVPPMLADNLNNSAILEYIWGDYAGAQQLYDEALEISERIGSAWGQMLAHAFRGTCQAEIGNYGTALTELQTAYAIARRMNLGITIIAATNLALAYAGVGEIQLGKQVIEIADHEIEIPLYRAPAKAALAYLVFLNGEEERAELILQDAHPRSQGGLEFSYLPSIIAEGEIGLARGNTARVIEYMEALATILVRFGIKSFVADTDMYRARALARQRRFAEARAAFERAETYATEIGSQRALWQIYAHWARWEHVQGNTARANELGQQACILIDQIAATLPETHRTYFQQQALAPLAPRR